MSRLFSDLQDGSGQQYYFGLNAAPGGISPAAGVVTALGLAPSLFIQEQVFRTPATATLTIRGVDFFSGLIVLPAQAALSASQLAPSLQTFLTVTPSAPPDYTALPDNPPSVLFINTVTPTTGLVTVQSLEFNLTQGGNIGFVSPLKATLTIQALSFGLTFFESGIGQIQAVGRAPTLLAEVPVEPEVGGIFVNGLAPTLSLPFTWIDVDAPPATQWTTTTGIAA